MKISRQIAQNGLHVATTVAILTVMEERSNLAAAIQAARISHLELALLAHVSRNTVSALRRGAAVPRAPQAERIHAVLCGRSAAIPPLTELFPKVYDPATNAVVDHEPQEDE